MTERPKQNDPAIKEKVIAELAKECAEWGSDKPEDWLGPLSRLWFHRNGYELASDLERYHGVSPDLQLVEILDGASSYIWSAHRDAVKAWVEANRIKPTLAKGTRIRCRYGVGVINDIREDEAIYLFIPDDEPNKEKYSRGGGVHVEYEDAEPIKEPA